jgi:hypothetical protein
MTPPLTIRPQIRPLTTRQWLHDDGGPEENPERDGSTGASDRNANEGRCSLALSQKSDVILCVSQDLGFRRKKPARKFMETLMEVRGCYTHPLS